MAHVREYPHKSSCGQPSSNSQTKFSFRDRTFVRWIQWFSWFTTVVRLVLSIQLDLPAFFLHRDSIEIWTSVMFSWSTFGLWWVACAEWLFEPVAAVDGNRYRFSSNLQWTWFCVCGLEEQRTNSSSSMSPSSWESSRRREKCENPPSQPNKKPPKQLTPNSANYEARLPNRLVGTSHTTCYQGQWHDQQSDRTETAIFCLQNDATVRRTVTTFVWPQTQFHENLHTNFVLQNLPINRLWNVCSQMEVGALLTCGSRIKFFKKIEISGRPLNADRDNLSQPRSFSSNFMTRTTKLTYINYRYNVIDGSLKKLRYIRFYVIPV